MPFRYEKGITMQSEKALLCLLDIKKGKKGVITRSEKA